MDRANLTKHREQMDQMLSGEIDSADVNTGYVHAQGLLVPVAGTHQDRQGGRRAGSLPARGRPPERSVQRLDAHGELGPEASARGHEAQAVAAHQRVHRSRHRLEADAGLLLDSDGGVDLRERVVLPQRELDPPAAALQGEDRAGGRRPRSGRRRCARRAGPARSRPARSRRSAGRARRAAHACARAAPPASRSAARPAGAGRGASRTRPARRRRRWGGRSSRS